MVSLSSSSPEPGSPPCSPPSLHQHRSKQLPLPPPPVAQRQWSMQSATSYSSSVTNISELPPPEHYQSYQKVAMAAVPSQITCEQSSVCSTESSELHGSGHSVPPKISSQSPISAMIKRRECVRSSNSNSSTRCVLWLRLMVCAGVLAWIGQIVLTDLTAPLRSLQQMHASLIQEHTDLLDYFSRETLENDLTQLETDTKCLQQSILEAQQQLESDIARVEQQLQHERASMQAFQQHAQTLLRERTVQTFGPGPRYFVELTLGQGEPAVNPTESSYIEHWITIETQSVQDAPVAVYTFLEQVRRGLWDNTSLVVQMYDDGQDAGYATLVASPWSVDGRQSRQDDFDKSPVPYPLFHETSHDCRGVPFAVRFPTRNSLGGTSRELLPTTTASSNFVVQTMQHDSGPCFGQAVLGSDLIEQVLQSREHRPMKIMQATIFERLHEQAQERFDNAKDKLSRLMAARSSSEPSIQEEL